MRRYPSMAAACMGLIAVGPVNGRAQDAAPAAEIFVGGSKLWEHVGGSGVEAGLYHNSGVKIAATGNLNRFLGLETDLSKFQDIIPTDYFRIMFGPHFAYNASSRLSPFAHALLGLTRQRLCGPTSCSLTSEEVGRNAFTVAIGGGLDVKVFRFFWLRPFQADYVHVFFPNAPENNLQLSFGVTLRFGSAGKTGKH